MECIRHDKAPIHSSVTLGRPDSLQRPVHLSAGFLTVRISVFGFANGCQDRARDCSIEVRPERSVCRLFQLTSLSTTAMSMLHVLLLVGALVINIPWLLVVRRRGRIASHSKSRLRLFSQQKYGSGVDEGDEHLSDGVKKTLKRHVRSGLLYVSPDYLSSAAFLHTA